MKQGAKIQSSDRQPTYCRGSCNVSRFRKREIQRDIRLIGILNFVQIPLHRDINLKFEFEMEEGFRI